MKPSFLAEFQALPPKEAKQVLGKLAMLTEDPRPDAKVKKQLGHIDGKLHRIRSGDYRVFYTFEKPFVSVLAVRKRDEKTYGDGIEGEAIGGLLPEIDLPVAGPVSQAGAVAQAVAAWPGELDSSKRLEKTPLPAPITDELLRRLRVPDQHFARLCAITTQDDLLNCPGVPDELLLRVDQALVELPLARVLAQPDLVVQEVDDLVHFKEGTLLEFLLKLDAEQLKYVEWRLRTSGPTLLKGGPGTGKSVVALYRAKAMIAALRAAGTATPRLLFTTYTNALMTSSRQLLQRLLGADAALVEIRTADSLAMSLAAQGQTLEVAKDDQVRRFGAEAARAARFTGNLLQKKAQKQTIERLGVDYVLEEIGQVIEARRLTTLEQYQAAARPGRDASLNKTQREGVWRVREAFLERLRAAKVWLWEEVRGRAAARVEQKEGLELYDAVIVDEAQDLQPGAIQMLTGLCRAPNRLFFTADANQSIYGGGFRWHDVHAELRFTGRTGMLKANYRSTRELGEAASAYLAAGELDPEREHTYVNSGPTPAVRGVETTDSEAKLLEKFLRTASRELRCGLGSCAVLAPTEKAGQRIAEALTARGVGAKFMASKGLDLTSKEVKVLTLRSAKGLEFPVVALAGFLDAPYPPKQQASEEEQHEVLARERRTMFVAMTRAMRALLLVVPAKTTSPLLTGFDPALWNCGGPV